MDSNTIGRSGELIAMSKYISLGYTVLQPVNKDGIYDFVIENNGIFKRVQVKTRKFINGLIKISLQRRFTKTTGVKYYSNDIDVFCVVDYETNDVYHINKSDCSISSLYLRKEKCINNQSKSVKLAKDYLI